MGGARNCGGSPKKRIGFCPHLRVHLSSQSLDKHFVIHLPSLSVDSAWGVGAGQGGDRPEPKEPHSAHSCLLTAPGTTAVSPGCPKIPADSSVGEQGQHEGTGGISWGLPLTRPPIQRGKWGGGGDGRWPGFRPFLLRCPSRCQEVVTGAARCRGWEPGPGPLLPGFEFWLHPYHLWNLIKPLWVSVSWSGNGGSIGSDSTARS